MGSDLDLVYVFKKLEVVTKLQNCPEACLLLIHNDSTAPGYCKLQVTLHGDPITKFHYKTILFCYRECVVS